MTKRSGWTLFLFFFAPLLVAAEERKVPFYFPQGIEKLETPAKQYEAYKRYWRVMQGCKWGHWTGADFSRGYRVERTYDGEKVGYTLDHVIHVGDKIYYYDFCEQREITPKERDLMVADFIQYVEGATSLGEYYNDLEPNAVKRRSENTGIADGDLRKQLDQPIPEDPKITYRDLTQIPKKITRATFWPKEIHLGENMALGLAYLNSRTAWIGPEARILDYITPSGRPLVGLHELIHTNVELQSYPMSDHVWVELMASVPMAFFDDEFMDLAGHGYLYRVREWAWVYLGYDFREVKKRVIKFDFAGNLWVDEKAFNEAYELQKKIKAEFLVAFKGLLAEYYSDQPYWGGVNDKLFDDQGVFDIGMALRYEPTILYDPKLPGDGHNQTMQWLEAHKEDVRRIALEAWNESGKPLDDSGDGTVALTQENIKLVERLTGMGREELVELAKKHGITARDAKGKSIPELMSLFNQIMERERGQKRGEVR